MSLITVLLLALYPVASRNVTSAGENPFTPKGYAMRYWKEHISNDLPRPEFLFSKASPLSTAQYASFSKLADQNSLSSQLPEFCSKANLLCFPDLAPKHNNYATDRVGGGNFKNYATDTVGGGDFKNYATTDRDNFKNYATADRVGGDNFKNYATDTVGGGDFKNYATEENMGDHSFNKNGYAKDRAEANIIFPGVNNTFKDYSKQGNNESSAVVASSGKKENKWVVEPGKFFRESMLKTGTIMHMPDIRDKFPKRSFLPRVIVSKLPFSTSKLADLRRIFHAVDDAGSMTKMLTNTLTECERAPSPGETKQCVASIEDMIDFATSVLGRNVAALTTESTRRYNGEVKIGKVKGINGGKLTKSVSCHQTLFPCLLYYFHSLPKVRVYEADILDPKSEARINRI